MNDRKDEENRCPICEGVIWKATKVTIEGAKIVVCQNCAQYGTKTSKQAPHLSQRKSFALKAPPPLKIKKFKQEEPVDEYEIVPEYAAKIKSARLATNLNQEKFARMLHEKESLIKKLESGTMEPTIELAKKIESICKITLIKKTDVLSPAPEFKSFLKKSDGSSLGDIAFIKKKK